MFDSLNEFPVRGSAVSALLLQNFRPDEVWVLKDIETLSSADARMLGDLWQRSRSAPIPLKTRELCSALALADQIVSLNVQLQQDAAVELIIEDGLRVV